MPPFNAGRRATLTHQLCLIGFPSRPQRGTLSTAQPGQSAGRQQGQHTDVTSTLRGTSVLVQVFQDRLRVGGVLLTLGLGKPDRNFLGVNPNASGLNALSPNAQQWKTRRYTLVANQCFPPISVASLDTVGDWCRVPLLLTNWSKKLQSSSP